MINLPDIIVLDFCVWLSERVERDYTLLRDALSRRELTLYAKRYLGDYMYYNHYRQISVRALAEGFLSSNEFRTLEEKYVKLSPFEDITLYRICHVLEKAFLDYVKQTFELMESFRYSFISPDELANHAFKYLSSSIDEDAKNNMKRLMIETKNDVSDEINFLVWVLGRENNPSSFKTMPAEVFDRLIVEYAQCIGIETKKIEKLKNDYYKTGWASVFERIQRWFMHNRKQPPQSLSYVINRYLSNRDVYKCIILPLADQGSQAQFSNLINDEWQNLNDLSGELLDIYYSEADIGKTGYDIANRISSLPDNLRKTAPSIVLWENAISEAKAIPTEGLSTAQIREIIQIIVQNIQAKKDFDTIIQEAKMAVEEKKILNHGVETYISGDKNVVIKGNTGNTFVNQGDNSKFGNISQETSLSMVNEELLQEVEEAICAIRDSNEINKESQKQLVSIMEDVKEAESENNDEKRSAAKKAFGYVKAFLQKDAPKLISILANLAQIASFFGLTVCP